MTEPLEDKPSVTEVLELAGGMLLGNGSGWSKAKCFDHADNSPSGSLNEDLCKFYCFSCGFRGDSIDIIMAWKGLAFKEALTHAQQLGVTSSGVDAVTPRTSLGRATSPRARSGAFRPSWRNM